MLVLNTTQNYIRQNSVCAKQFTLRRSENGVHKMLEEYTIYESEMLKFYFVISIQMKFYKLY